MSLSFLISLCVLACHSKSHHSLDVGRRGGQKNLTLSPSSRLAPTTYFFVSVPANHRVGFFGLRPHPPSFPGEMSKGQCYDARSRSVSPNGGEEKRREKKSDFWPLSPASQSPFMIAHSLFASLFEKSRDFSSSFSSSAART